MTVNDKEYRTIRLLGKGKSGYSYLVTNGTANYVVKQIHHEPCFYYQFGNKLEAELQAYAVLRNIGILLPELLEVDFAQERILKEYIAGETVFDLVLREQLQGSQLEQMRSMCKLLYQAKKNIDYFPTNFVVHNFKLYYVDYECNDYMDEWNFENWGEKYWSLTEEFLQYVKEHTRRENDMFEDIYSETDRLIVKPVAIEDYENFVAGYRNCKPAINRFDEVYPDTSFMTVDWFEKLIERRHLEAERDYSYKFEIYRKTDGVIIGFCNIFPHYREDFQYAHIGYCIHNNYWGNGYGSECILALTEIGFNQLGLHRLEAHVNLDNYVSKHVLQKAGYHFECIRKGFICEDGVWTDNEIYYLNKTQEHDAGNKPAFE